MAVRDPRVLAEVLRVARRRHVKPRQLKSGVLTGLVESNFSNPSGGDGDSAGWRQERRKYYRDPTNVTAAAERYFDEAAKLDTGHGSAAQLAQRVQRSAFPGRYAERSAEADQILRDKGVSAGGATPARATGKAYKSRGYDLSRRDIEGAIIDTLASGRPGSKLKQVSARLDSGAYDSTEHRPGPNLPARVAAAQGTDQPAGGGKVVVQPGANRPGHGLQPYAKAFAGSMSRYGGTIRIGTGTQHNRLTVNGNVSDHWDGSAFDVPASGAGGDKVAYAAFRAAGVDDKTAWRYARNGGLYNVDHGGYRVQIIWKTNEGGNHFNHVHVGLRKK